MRKRLIIALICLGLAGGSLWLAVVSAHITSPRAQQSPQAVMLVINEYLASPGSCVASSAGTGPRGRSFSPGTRVDGSTSTVPLPPTYSISPTLVVAGSGHVPLIITRSNFHMGSQVRVDANAVTTCFTDVM